MQAWWVKILQILPRSSWCFPFSRQIWWPTTTKSSGHRGWRDSNKSIRTHSIWFATIQLFLWERKLLFGFNLLMSWLIFCPKKLSKAMVFRMMWKKSHRWSSLSWHQFLLLIRVSKWIYSSQVGFIENFLVKTWAQACLHGLHYLNSSTRSGERSLAWLSRKAPIQNSEAWKLPWMKSCCEVSECENEYDELKCENMWKAE